MFLPTLRPHESRALIHSCKPCLLSPQVFETGPLRLNPIWSLCSAVAPSSLQIPYLFAAAVSQQSTAVPFLKTEPQGFLKLFILSSLIEVAPLALTAQELLGCAAVTHLASSPDEPYQELCARTGVFVPRNDQKLHWWNYARDQVCRFLLTFQWLFDGIVFFALGQI